MWRKGVWPKEERKKHSEKEREGWEITAAKEKTQEKRRNLTKARASETDRWGKKRGRRHGGQTWWSSDVCLSSSHHSLFSPRLSFLCLNYRPPICFWLPLSFLACFGEGGILIHHHLKEDFTWKSSSYGLWKKLMEILRFPASLLFSMLYKWTCFRLCFFFFSEDISPLIHEASSIQLKWSELKKALGWGVPVPYDVALRFTYNKKGRKL